MADVLSELNLTMMVQRPGRGILAGIKVAIVACLVIALYGFTLTDMARDWWSDGSFSQGLLIAPLAAYIAWLRRPEIAARPLTPDNGGFLLLVLGAVMFLVGKLGAEFFLMRVSFVVVLAGMVWIFWGIGRLRVLGFPFALLATMVPLPALLYSAITSPLQLFASGVASDLAQLLGTTVYRDGNIIHLAHISLGVEEACSGLNSLSALMVGSLLLGFALLRRTGPRLVLFFLAIPLAIGVNIMRITGTAILADYHEQFAQGFYHLFSGWLVFLVGFGLLYLICMGLGKWGESAR